MVAVDQMIGRADATEAWLTKQLVRRQMNQGGNILLCGLEPLSDEEFFAEAPNGISVAWTVGHLACVLDLFTSWVEGRDKIIPTATHNVFNSLDIGKKAGSKAAAVDPEVYSKGDLLLLFRQAQVRGLECLDAFDMRRWNDATQHPVPDTLPTWGAIWQALGVHTFWHLGELSGCIERFHGTYTLNTVTHYFYTDRKLSRVAEQ